MTDYKPGTVAVATVREVPDTPVYRFEGRWVTPESIDGRIIFYDDGGGVTDVRPLAVIDPDDRKQVGRLLETYGQQFSPWQIPEFDKNVTRLQAALREYADPTPPKPDEPTGLGSVVTDKNGVKWVRAGDEHGMRNWVRENSAMWRTWDEIEAQP